MGQGGASAAGGAGTAGAESTFSIGGTVSGLSGELTLSNGSDALMVSMDGSFVFASELSDGAAYAVKVGTQPAGQLCEVTNGSGVVGGADVTDVTVLLFRALRYFASVKRQITPSSEQRIGMDFSFETPMTMIRHDQHGRVMRLGIIEKLSRRLVQFRKRIGDDGAACTVPVCKAWVNVLPGLML